MRLRTKIKKIITTLLVLSLLAPSLPVYKAEAATATVAAAVTSFSINKNFDGNGSFVAMTFTIKGTDLDAKNVFLFDNKDQKITSTPIVSGTARLTYTLTALQNLASVMIDNSEYDVGSVMSAMPFLTFISPKTIAVNTAALELRGSNLNFSSNASTSAIYGKEGAQSFDIKSVFTSSSTVSVPKELLGTAIGNCDIVFTRDTTVGAGIPVMIKHSYSDAFRTVSRPDIAGLELTKNYANTGGVVRIRALSSLQNYDVYLASEYFNVIYTDAFKGKSPTATSTPDDSKYWYLDFTVSTVPLGEYYVVLTAKGDPGKIEALIPSKAGSSLPYDKLIIVESGKLMQVNSVLPNSGPYTGTPSGGALTVIKGSYLGRPNIDGLILDSTITPDVTMSVTGKSLQLAYGSGSYNGITASSVTVDINSVQIGGECAFRSKATAYDLQSDNKSDELSVQVPENLSAKDVAKKVSVYVSKTITIKDASGNAIAIISDNAILKDGYTYLPGTAAVFDSVNPALVQIYEDADGRYKVVKSVNLLIKGSDFVVTRFTENGAERIIRPRVGIEGIDPSISLNEQVYDSTNKPVDGSDDKQKAATMRVTIPAGTVLADYDPASAQTKDRNITISNPITGTNVSIDTVELNALNFVVVDESKTPVINNVFPAKVPSDKSTEVTLTGYNFNQGLILYIDGRKVAGVSISDFGRKITFNTIVMPEIGIKQILIQNIEGGTAVADIDYARYGSAPKIDSIVPNQGSSGTAVTINGSNFRLPDPQGTTEGAIDTLIGSKVLLGDRYDSKNDLNDKFYNKDGAGKVEVKNYSLTANSIIISRGSTLEMPDIYRYLLLTDGVRFYKLDYGSDGTPVLKTDATSSYLYKFSLDSEGKIIATAADGTIAAVAMTENSLKVGSSEMSLMTLYKFKLDSEFSQIGATVMLDGRIYIRIPPMTPAKYDVTVVNPDGSFSTVTEGFTYTVGTSNPLISAVDPQVGDAQGGYRVTVSGSGFSADADVIVDGKSVRKEYASDKTAVLVSSGGDLIDFIMPKYGVNGRDDLAKIAKELWVRLVVSNPDFASSSLENGFKYVVPTIVPKIISANPLTSNAKGGSTMEIVGSNFIVNGKSPDVYFGSIKMPTESINTTSDSSGVRLIFKTPALLPGKYKLYVINADGGVSNMMNYTAVASSPVITAISPDRANRKGGLKAEIIGSDFIGADSRVRFGSITNLDVPRLAALNSGLIVSGKTHIELDGGLKVDYDASGSDTTIGIEIKDGDITYSGSINGYDNGLLYADISSDVSGTDYSKTPLGDLNYSYYRVCDLKTSDTGIKYPGFEMLKFNIVGGRLFVERGYVPLRLADLGSATDTKIPLVVPSYFKKAIVDVTLFNPDGGNALGKFTYTDPLSNPLITNVLKDGKLPDAGTGAEQGKNIVSLSFKGGNTIDVLGEGFTENAKIKIFTPDNVEIIPSNITYDLTSNPQKLTFTTPEVKETSVGQWKLGVINEDEGIALSSDAVPPIWLNIFKIDFAPITGLQIMPSKGPARGGNVVKISGQGFVPGISVYVGGVKATLNDIKSGYALVVIPPHAPGEVTVRVADRYDNPLGTVAYTYLTEPVIEKVVNPADDNLFESTIPVDAGKQLKITGLYFAQGARVVFVPKANSILNEADYAMANVFIGGLPYLLASGYEGTGVTVAADGKSLLVTSPAGKLGESGLMVINPDGAATDIYGDVEYTLKQPDTPLNVMAELVSKDDTDMFVKVAWTGVTGATLYDVFVQSKYKGDSNYSALSYVGNTPTTGYVFMDLAERTSYKFVIKAVGDFASSPPSAESNEVGPTGNEVGIPDDDNKPIEDTRIDIVGDLVNVIIGNKDYDSQGQNIDLTSGMTAGANKVIIALPADAVTSSSSKDITVTGKDFVISFNPQIFNVGSVRNYDKNDQGVRVQLTKNSGNPNLAGKPLLSQQYEVKAEAFSGKSTEALLHTTGYYRFALDYDPGVAKLRKLKKAVMLRRDGTANVKVGESPIDEFSSSITGLSDRTGIFMVTGER